MTFYPYHGHGSNRGGKRPSRIYTCWVDMLARCRNPRSRNWRYYGAKGVTVCERWLRFENFLEDMGPMPDDLTLDRIDVLGHYEPGNCRWATRQEQSANRRPKAKGQENPLPDPSP